VSRLAFGIAAGPRDGTERLGAAVESLGYDGLWANDSRRGSGLATLAAAAAAGVTHLRLGVGVIALSERGPERIAREVEDAIAVGLPRGRLVLGIGSGASRSRALVRRGVAELRDLLPSVPLAVAAVGPRMCALGGAVADVVLLNWSRPEHLALQREWIAEGAASTGRGVPEITAYVRVAVGPGAEARLRGEMERYARHSPAYTAIFGAQTGLVGVASSGPADLRAALLPYRAILDTCIVRGLPDGDAVDDWLRVAEAAADP
jgi:alkanesulfonate monooxygenase SsuD/methylene tetrahydromethanopterin reductase-like flavin-dependent oxidoreductase (luciferase family)